MRHRWFSFWEQGMPLGVCGLVWEADVGRIGLRFFLLGNCYFRTEQSTVLTDEICQLLFRKCRITGETSVI